MPAPSGQHQCAGGRTRGRGGSNSADVGRSAPVEQRTHGLLLARRLDRSQHVGEQARRRLDELIGAAKKRLAGEKDAALRRAARWLSQSQGGKADAQRVLQAEGKVYDEAASALDGARLELDQAALVQLT